MAALTWDTTGSRVYETGVSNGVLYVWNDSLETPAYDNGVAWNGLISVTESPSGGEATSIYADNIKYLTLMSAEELGGTIEAYTYPDAFANCDGSVNLATGMSINLQHRAKFCLVYKTKVGNDASGDAYGYKIHILYNCLASPSEKAYQTINDSPEAITFSWEFSSTPESVTGANPTSLVIIDSTKFTTTADKEKLAAVEAALFGSESGEPTIKTPNQIKGLITGNG